MFSARNKIFCSPATFDDLAGLSRLQEHPKKMTVSGPLDVSLHAICLRLNFSVG